MSHEEEVQPESTSGEEQPESTAAAGTKEYVLDDSSESTEVSVDDKTLTKNGESVALTQDQYDRVSKLEGVKLTEASAKSEEG